MGTTKRYLTIFGVMLVATALVVCISLVSATSSSAPTISVAGPETQFRVDIAYAYVGEGPSNASYTAANGDLMSIVSQYPSAVELNITCLPGVQITSCDAEIEIYDVQIATNTGLIETNPYFIGTNYISSFSSSDLSTLFVHANDLINPENFSTSLRGNFEFNMTANTSVLSVPIGSVGCYSTAIAGSGLWSAGQPNAISVTIQRIGYVTISNGSVSLYKNPSNNTATATAQLSNYGNGFLYNSLVPADKLQQINLFHPIQPSS